MRKLLTGAIALTMGLALGAPLASAANMPNALDDEYFPGWEDDRQLNGMRDIGHDISDVELTFESVHAYLASLSPDSLRGAIGGCQTLLANPAMVNSRELVLPFCELALGITPVRPVVITGAAG
jgi:hypothetical protein